jgi:uncharacterized protein YceK
MISVEIYKKMRRPDMKKILFLCSVVVLISGCGTISTMNNSCVSEGFNHLYNDYVIDVTSDPPGAKIDWNGEYIGTTPLKRVLNGRRGMAAPAVVTAHAVSSAQSCQTQNFPGSEPLPTEIHFDFNE